LELEDDGLLESSWAVDMDMEGAAEFGHDGMPKIL